MDDKKLTKKEEAAKKSTADMNAKSREMRQNTKKVKVLRTNMDAKNQDLIISVNDMGDLRNGFKEFMPNTEVVLNEAQIGILESAVESNVITIPQGSAIYGLGKMDAIKAITDLYKGFKARAFRGMWQAVKEVANYVVVEVK